MKKCLLDCDGVIVDFVAGAIALHNLPKDLYNNLENLGNFDLITLSGLSPEEFWQPMGFDFWKSLPWTKEGRDIVNLVVNKFGRENICLLTAPCNTFGCCDGKLTWIRTHLPDFKNQWLLGRKKEFCARECHYLIDDRDQNIADFNAHGGNGILVSRPWNKEYRHRNHVIETLNKKLDQI